MKLYWSDREGKEAPPSSTFYFRSFFSEISEPLFSQRISLPQPISYKAMSKTFSPDFETWKMNVEKAIQLINKEKLEKVVLARTLKLEFDRELDPFRIASALQSKAKGAYIFCFETDQGTFLGATPERLFKREGNLVISEALAGTRPRGLTPEEDEKLKKELLSSAKDLREFSPVRSFIKNALSPLCASLPLSTPISVHQTKNVQHLYSRITAKLKNQITDEQILSQLHPTPALCGLPITQAKELIRKLELFDRGFYGGSFGWSSPEASEWIVGIRSCFIQGNQAILYSGTGIVDGSKPEDEWEELNQKIKLYEGILDY